MADTHTPVPFAELAGRIEHIPLLDELRARTTPDEYELVLLFARDHVTRALEPGGDLRIAGMALAVAAALFAAAIVEWSDLTGAGRRRN